MSFKVAIIGRPNVGKSTLFNRLTGKNLALVHNKPGLTRDRKEAEASIAQLKFKLVDTAGLEIAETGSIEELMMKQTLYAIDEADIVLLVVDGREGITSLDEHFANIVRRKSKPTILIVNKAESEKNSPGIYESYKLGFGEPVVMSAEHGLGLGDLYDEITTKSEELFLDLKQAENDIENNEREEFSIAIIGRPNAGKSTLFNAILMQDRAISSEIAGTTRDSIFEFIEFNNHKIKLIDTAGIRKKYRHGDFLEEISVKDSIKALNLANIIVLLIDGKEGIDKIELSLVGRVFEEGKGLVIAINKWDILTIEERKKILETLETYLEYSLTEAKTCEIINISAIYKDNRKQIDKILSACEKTFENRKKKISTSKLNDWLKEATENNIPPISCGKRIKLKFVLQTNINPPSFTIFTSSNLKELPNSYIRYLKNNIRERFQLYGTAIRISVKKTKNPYIDSLKEKS